MLVDRFGNAFQNLSEQEQDTGEKWIDGKPNSSVVAPAEISPLVTLGATGVPDVAVPFFYC